MNHKRSTGVLTAVLAFSMAMGAGPVAGVPFAYADDLAIEPAVEVTNTDPADGLATQPNDTTVQNADGAQNAESTQETKATEGNKTETEALVLSAEPAEQVAAEPASDHKHGDTAFVAWTATDKLPTEAGNYYLENNVTLTATWEVSADISLCLNGKTVTANFFGTDGGRAVHVNTGATLNLYDEGGDKGQLQAGTGYTIANGIDVAGGATLNMYGGTITGFLNGVMTDLKAADEATGEKASFGKFVMSGGVITGNKQLGVYVFSGSFEMNDGSIRGNGGKESFNGAGVYVSYSDFTMTGGEIIENTSYGSGAGVYLFKAGDCKITGGLISGNVALCNKMDKALSPAADTNAASETEDANELPGGGGVYLDKSKLEISGAPVIIGNTAKATPNRTTKDVSSNVFIGADEKDQLSVTGKLDELIAEVGVTHVDSKGAVNTAAFTTGYKGAENTLDPSSYFVSDDEGYAVVWTEDGKEARLATAYTVIIDSTIKNGVVTPNIVPNASKQFKAAAGQTVVLSVLPGVGYMVDTVSVVDANKKAVELKNNSFVMPASDVTVSATFAAAEHTITFNANGGSGNMANQIAKLNEYTKLNANAFTRTGYTFTGWNTQADGKGTSYADKATAKFNEDVTLYAQWKQNTTARTTTATTRTLAATGDAASVAPVVSAVVTGIGLAIAGLRKRK